MDPDGEITTTRGDMPVADGQEEPATPRRRMSDHCRALQITRTIE